MNQKNKLLFFTEASPSIGLGHLMRCLALSNMLKEQFESHFVVFADPDIALSILNDWDGTFEISPAHDAARNLFVADYLNRNAAKFYCVVVDGISFTMDLFRIVRNLVKRLIEIQDGVKSLSEADLCINHAPIASVENDRTTTRYLFGLEYALLRPSFLERARRTYGQPVQQRSGNSPCRVFVCFGGADPLNLTMRSLQVLRGWDHSAHIDIVIGAGFSHAPELTRLAESQGNIEIYRQLQEEELIHLLNLASFAVVPASTILMEVLCVGIPVISGWYAENQQALYRGLKQRNCFVDAEQFSAATLRQAIESILVNPGPARVFDGRSPERIIKEVVAL